MTHRRTRGATLLEILVASGLLGVLILAASSALTYAARPATETSVRSFLVTQGGLSMSRLVRELEGGSFAPSACILDPSNAFNPVAAQTTPAPPPTVYVGDAIEFQRVLGWTVGPPSSLNLDPDAIRFVFEPDGAGGQQLVRAQNGLTVTIQTDVDPASGPHFQLVAPATLTVTFAVRRPTSRDGNGALQFTRVAFEQRINLRNLNQP